MFNLVVGTLANMLLTVLAAFVLTRKYFYLRNFMMKMMIFTMFFSGGLIPLFFVVKHVGIYNTRWANFLPYLVSTYNVIIMRSFFASLPESLEEAALIDGANEGQILRHVILPLSKPVLATVSLWVIVSHWNDYLNPLMFLSSRENYTLQLILKELVLNAVYPAIRASWYIDYEQHVGGLRRQRAERSGNQLRQRAGEVLHHRDLHAAHYVRVSFPDQIF